MHVRVRPCACWARMRHARHVRVRAVRTSLPGLRRAFSCAAAFSTQRLKDSLSSASVSEPVLPAVPWSWTIEATKESIAVGGRRGGPVWLCGLGGGAGRTKRRTSEGTQRTRRAAAPARRRRLPDSSPAYPRASTSFRNSAAEISPSPPLSHDRSTSTSCRFPSAEPSQMSNGRPGSIEALSRLAGAGAGFGAMQQRVPEADDGGAWRDSREHGGMAVLKPKHDEKEVT